MKRIRALILVLFIFILGGPKLVVAQDVHPVFLPSGEWVDSTDSRYYEQVQVKYSEELENDKWPKVFQAVAEDFSNTTVDWDTAPEVQKKLQNQLGKLVFKRFEELEENKTINKFQPITSYDALFYFPGEENTIWLCPKDVEWDECEGKPGLSVEQAKDVRYRIETVHALFNSFFADHRSNVVNIIIDSDEKWNNFIENGYSMYPWEGLINSWFLNYDIKNPPRHQWIIAHPSIGLEVPGQGIYGGLEDLRAKEVLVVEWLGNIRYTGDVYKNYFGVSAITTLRDDIGLGIGGMVHFSRTLRAGITWHFSGQSNRTFIKDPFFTFSVDLLGLVKTKRKVVKKYIGAE